MNTNCGSRSSETRTQLTAVGRGGELDLAQRWTNRQVALDVIHRFTRTDTTGTTGTVPDAEYADLMLAMRTGDDPGAVFDRLVARGQVVIHDTDDDRTIALAERAAANLDPANSDAARSGAVVADTRAQVQDLNQAIRARRVGAGRVDDTRPVDTDRAETIGVGDVVATRRNDTKAGVANRDTWTVTAITADGGMKVTGPGRGPDPSRRDTWLSMSSWRTPQRPMGCRATPPTSATWPCPSTPPPPRPTWP